MKAFGATSLNGHITSQSALKTRAKVFGEDNLVFFDHYTGKHSNKSYSELLKEENPNVNVVVDLKPIDTSTWKRPERVT